MQDTQPCPSCGAKNHASADWCSQCYTPLGVPPEPLTPEPESESEALAQSLPTGAPISAPVIDSVTTLVDGGEIEGGPQADADKPSPTWTCRSCETVNPVTVNQCSACNTSIFSSFGATSETEPLLDPQEALRYALVPGLAHVKMQQSMFGATIAILVAALWFMGVLLFVGGQIAAAVALVLISLVILGGSVHDAIRLAERRPDEIVLKPRILTVIGGAAVLMVIVVIWNQGFVS